MTDTEKQALCDALCELSHHCDEAVIWGDAVIVPDFDTIRVPRFDT